MKSTAWLSLFVSLFIFSSCMGSGYEPTVNGDYAEVKLEKSVKFKGELIAVTDSFIYMDISRKVVAVPSNKLDEVYIDKYTDRSWLFGVTLLEVIPAFIISGVAASLDVNFAVVLGVTIIPAIVSTLLFELSTPKSTYDEFNEKSSLESLKKYSRFPGGITGNQLKEFLKSYGQDSCIYVK